MRLKNSVPFLLLLVATLWTGVQAGWGQAAPDLIVYNGKIITVSDKSFTSNLGTIAQAVAVRDSKITAVGNNAEIRAQAGPNTKQIDLEGRTVVPSIIVVHDHPYDWAPQNPYALKKVLGTDDVIVARYMTGPPVEQAKAFPGVLQEAVSKAKPGQWIFIAFSLGDKYQTALEREKYGNIFDRKMITLEQIDQLAPNHPVFLRDPFVGVMVNTKGMDVIEKTFPNEDMKMDRKTGGGGGSVRGIMDWGFHDVVMKDHYKELREIHRIELSWWASLGVGAFSSRAYTPSNLKVYKDLSDSGEMPVRNGYSWGWRETFFNSDTYLLNTAVLLRGTGSDYFWNAGAWGAERVGSGCTTATPRVELPPGANQCRYDPSQKQFKLIVEFVKAGGRVAGLHMGGDLDMEYLMEAIEKGSKEAGLTPQQIAANRHNMDHLTMGPRPDQIQRLKRLGMAVGGAPFFYMENAPQQFERYGEAYAEWNNPKKSLIDAEVVTGFEIDRPLATTSLTVFWTLARFVDRKAPDGKVYGQNQRISRELALKSATIWGANYMEKEATMGALETGKLADFLVLDRDYLTIPEADLENIRVLATFSGGTIRHLIPSLARKWGMQPVGAQVELGGPAAQW